MSVAILKEINITEKQAEQIELSAQQKAREIIATAKKDAASVIDKAVEKAEMDAARLIKSAEDKAANDIIDMNEKIHVQCDEIKKSADIKLNDVVDIIVGRIVKIN